MKEQTSPRTYPSWRTWSRHEDLDVTDLLHDVTRNKILAEPNTNLVIFLIVNSAINRPLSLGRTI
jgi:hypothetical protein